MTEKFKQYYELAQTGDACAQCDLASCYKQGVGVAKDLAEAIKLYV